MRSIYSMYIQTTMYVCEMASNITDADVACPNVIMTTTSVNIIDYKMRCIYNRVPIPN